VNLPDRQIAAATGARPSTVRDCEDFERVVEMATATIRGLVVLDTLHPEGKRAQAMDLLRERLVELLEGSESPHGR
jgi:hypothetical protein